jgi:hypothetical protein
MQLVLVVVVSGDSEFLTIKRCIHKGISDPVNAPIPDDAATSPAALLPTLVKNNRRFHYPSVSKKLLMEK